MTHWYIINSNHNVDSMFSSRWHKNSHPKGRHSKTQAVENITEFCECLLVSINEVFSGDFSTQTPEIFIFAFQALYEQNRKKTCRVK